MLIKRIEPGPGQESVWDYPRPPRLEEVSSHIQVVFQNIILADTHSALRVLETSHPPVYYIPPEDIQMQYLLPASRSTFCEWKGAASYYDLSVGEQTVLNVAWYYPHPTQAFAQLANYVAFYPSLVDACFVDGERVQAQPGTFYGGWVTSKVVGPFKGSPSTLNW